MASETPKEKKKMGIFKKILIGFAAFFGVIIIAVGVIVALNWDNVTAFYVAMTNDTETIERKIRESDKEFASEVKDYLRDTIRDYNDEEQAAIADGSKTEIQVIAEIISEKYGIVLEDASEAQNENDDSQSGGNSDASSGGAGTSSGSDTDTSSGGNTGLATDTKGGASSGGSASAGSTDKSAAGSGSGTTAKTSGGSTAEDIVARHVANLYSYQSSFEGRVSALAGSASAYCKSYKANNPGVSWHDAKVAAVSALMSQAQAIESDCYAKVDAEVAALRSELAAIGADTSIADTVQASAENTMSLKKSQIMSQYASKMGG